MAVNPIKPITAASATATNGSVTITVFGSVSTVNVYDGTIVHLGDFTPVEAVSGTAVNIATGESTITLREPWPEVTTTARLTAFNSIEGLGQAIQRARDVVANTAAIEALAGTGLVEKTGATTYDTIAITAAGKALIDDTTITNQRTTLGLGTAATATVTTSATDMTSGRLLSVRDAGYVFNKRIFNTKEFTGIGDAPVVFYLGKFRHGFHKITLVNKGNSGYNTCAIELSVDFSSNGTDGSSPHSGVAIQKITSTMDEVRGFHSVKVSSDNAALYVYYDAPAAGPQTLTVGYDSFTTEQAGVGINDTETWTPIDTVIAVADTHRVTEYLQVVGTLSSNTLSYKSNEVITEGNRELVGNWGGNTSEEITDFTLAINAGTYRASTATATGGPDTLSYFVSVLVENAVDAGGQIFTVRRLTQTLANMKTWQGARINSTGAITWVEIYNTGNSVNPLDYGLGTQASSQAPDIAATDNTQIRSGISKSSGIDAMGWGGNVLTMRYSNLRQSQLGIRTTSTLPSIAFRTMPDDNQVWRGPYELYGEHNTNFNVFGGASESIIGAGVARATTTIYVGLPINSPTNPTGLTIVGNFVLRDKTGNTSVATGLTGADIVLAKQNKKNANLLVTVPSGLVAGDTYLLTCADNTSKLTVDF